jgi:hypothetical protein
VSTRRVRAQQRACQLLVPDNQSLRGGARTGFDVMLLLKHLFTYNHLPSSDKHGRPPLKIEAVQ